jgi:hypothetical protein
LIDGAELCRLGRDSPIDFTPAERPGAETYGADQENAADEPQSPP